MSAGPPASAGRAGDGRAGAELAGTGQTGTGQTGTGQTGTGQTGTGQTGTGTGGERPGWPFPGRLNRRRVLGAGLGGLATVAAAGAGAIELAAHGIVPGRQLMDRLDGACSVAGPPPAFSAPGPSVSGTFYSRARHREVGYVIAWPPGHRPGAPLPLIVVLHPFGADHLSALTGMSPPQALALRVGGRPLPPMAMAAADGGPGYWNPHPGDDPIAMGVRALTRVLPPGAVTDVSQGCHSYPFFVAQEPPSLAFLGRHLTG